MGDPIGAPIAITERQKEIFQRIVAENTIGRRKFSDDLGLNALKNKGVLKRIGGTRGHWEVTLKKTMIFDLRSSLLLNYRNPQDTKSIGIGEVIRENLEALGYGT